MNNNTNLENLKIGLAALYEAAGNLITVTAHEEHGSIEFGQAGARPVDNTGLVWHDQNGVKKLVYRTGPDRIWSSQALDLHQEAYYAIGNVPVLRFSELGNTVVRSNLRTLGTIQNFKTTGDFVLDNHIYWNSNNQRLGIGTSTANAKLSVVGLQSEYIIDHKDHAIFAGTWTTTDLCIVTDNTPRIIVASNGDIAIGKPEHNNSKVSIYGRLGIGITNVDPNVNLEIKGAVRLDGKRMQSGFKIPDSGHYKKGDLIWNTEPKPNGYIGWICVRDGTPGIWKSFGKISE